MQDFDKRKNDNILKSYLKFVRITEIQVQQVSAWQRTQEEQRSPDVNDTSPWLTCCIQTCRKYVNY